MTQPAAQGAPVKPPVSRGKLLVIIAVLLIALVAVVALFVVPVSHTFSGTVSTSYCSSCSPHYVGFVTENFPSGPSVTLNWQSTSSAFVNFSVFQTGDIGAGGCSQSGVSGSCVFDSNGGTWTIYVEDYGNEGSVIVTFSGSYSAPYA